MGNCHAYKGVLASKCVHQLGKEEATKNGSYRVDDGEVGTLFKGEMVRVVGGYEDGYGGGSPGE